MYILLFKLIASSLPVQKIHKTMALVPQTKLFTYLCL